MKIKIIIPFLIAVLSLTGCPLPQYVATDQQINSVKHDIDRASRQFEVPPPSSINKEGVYADTNPVSLQKPPAWLKHNINIHGSSLPFTFYVNKILQGINVDVSYQHGLNNSQLVALNYSGTIKGALTKLASETGYAYRINHGRLTWSDMVTKTFDISFMPGTSRYVVGGQGTNGSKPQGGGAYTTYFGDLGTFKEQYSNFRGDISVWRDLKQTLDKLKSKQGKVVVSEATTTVTVFDHPQNVTMMAAYLKRLNEELSRQVSLQVQVLEVNLNKNYNYGIDWNIVRRVMGASFGLTGSLAQPISVAALGSNLSPALAGISIIGITGSKWAGTRVLINALKQQGKVSVVTEPKVVTLNNQVAEIGINTLTGYLAEVSTTQTGAVGQFLTQSLTPGVVKTGFSLYILPKIEHGRVYLQISSTISDLQNIQTISGNGSTDSTSSSSSTTAANQIQVPTVNEKSFNQRSLVLSGSTLIVAGFKQLRNNNAHTSMFGVPSSQGASTDNVETIVLITPTILN